MSEEISYLSITRDTLSWHSALFHRRYQPPAEKEQSTYFPPSLSGTDLLVLLWVPLTVLLADGGPADGAHVVHAAPLVHHQPGHREPGPRPPPGQQHAALLVVVARVISRQPGVLVWQEAAAEVTSWNARRFKHQKHMCYEI